MNTPMRQRFLSAAMACLLAFAAGVHAQATDPSRQADAAPLADGPATPARAESESPPPGTGPAEGTPSETLQYESRWPRHSNNPLVSIGGDSTLRKGESAEVVVSVFGSSTSDGDVDEAVVSVFGTTRVTGSVGDAAVAVFGDNYVNGKISGNVVAVLGDIELGPDAEIGGDVVSVGGEIRRDPKAVVHGGVQNVFGMHGGALTWLRPWIRNCLVYLRPLAIAPGLGWAWALALGFLALYALVALMFRDTVDRCVDLVQKQTGKTVLASVLAVLLTPVMFTLLCITVIGIAFVPLAAAGLFFATLFGKVVVLAWIGRCFTRLLGEGSQIHTAVAVLAGGVVVIALYLVPVLGFIVYKSLGVLGFGVAVYALLLSFKARRDDSGGTFAPAGTAAGAAGFASSAASAGSANFAGQAGASAPGASTPGASTPGEFGASTSGIAGAAPDAGAVPTAALPRAGFAIRMGALFIDAVIIGVLTSFLTLHAFHEPRQFQLIVLAAYGAVMWKLKGTTIGGIVFNLQVVRVDGRPMDWATSIVRALSCFLSLVALGLGFFWIAFDEGRQGWHDKIAGTAVVRVPKGVSLL